MVLAGEMAPRSIGNEEAHQLIGIYTQPSARRGDVVLKNDNSSDLLCSFVSLFGLNPTRKSTHHLEPIDVCELEMKIKVTKSHD